MKQKVELYLDFNIFTTLNKVFPLRRSGQMFMTMHASETWTMIGGQ